MSNISGTRETAEEGSGGLREAGGDIYGFVPTGPFQKSVLR